jgi:hypothetical protein
MEIVLPGGLSEEPGSSDGGLLTLDLFMEGMAAQIRVVLHLFDASSLLLFVPLRHVTRRPFALLASFCAL